MKISVQNNSSEVRSFMGESIAPGASISREVDDEQVKGLRSCDGLEIQIPMRRVVG